MYSKEQVLEILQAYDLTKSLRSAAALVGCDHHTVARYVAARDAGLDPSEQLERPSVTDPFVDKINEWIDRSEGRIRADVVHEGDGATARRALACQTEAAELEPQRVALVRRVAPLLLDHVGVGPVVAGRNGCTYTRWRGVSLSKQNAEQSCPMSTSPPAKSTQPSAPDDTASRGAAGRYAGCSGLNDSACLMSIRISSWCCCVGLPATAASRGSGDRWRERRPADRRAGRRTATPDCGAARSPPADGARGRRRRRWS